jgi:MFS family permease
VGSTLPPLMSLLASVAILLFGHGLQLILLPLRAKSLGWSTDAIGLTGSAYFLGFVIGCTTVPRLIARVGHIRTFAVLSAMASSTLLALYASDSFFAWLVLRLVTGWALSGLYLVIESWLNERTSSEQRGRVMSIYTVITLAGIGGAQLLIATASPDSPQLFFVGSMLLSLSIVPVGLTRAIMPSPVSTVSFRLAGLMRRAPVTFVCGLLSGMITGAFWALGPVYASSIGLPPASIGLFMGAVVLGGAAFQLPSGRLSDHLDRRLVILLLCAGGAIAALVGSALQTQREAVVLALAFLYGGASMPLYALCVAHANDRSPAGEFVETASGTLMMNSIGSVIGPVLAALLMSWLGPPGYFVLAALCFAAGVVWCTIRLGGHAEARDYFEPYVALPDTTQGVIDMDPRST